MAYYPQFNGYQNPYGQLNAQTMYQPQIGYQALQNNAQSNNDERIWVQGQGAAEAYLVGAGGFVRLWDSSQPVFYEKRADASGRPYMETFTYTRKDAQAPVVNASSVGGTNYDEVIKNLEMRLSALEKEAQKHDE